MPSSTTWLKSKERWRVACGMARGGNHRLSTGVRQERTNRGRGMAVAGEQRESAIHSAGLPRLRRALTGEDVVR